ncbi:hypothetical protein [Tsuneonella sp. HG222]
MDKNPEIPLADALAAAQDWWRLAGVDSDFADEPVNWLAKPETQRADAPAAPVDAPAPPPVPPIGGPREGWPQTLADFAPWWAALPELPGAGPAIAPCGEAEPELLVLVPMPEAEDRDGLLSGRQGTMIANMLRAMGIADGKALVAAALPRHASHPDWEFLAARGLGGVLSHLLTLAAPQRVLVLGREMLPLFGHGPAQGGAAPQEIALENLPVPVLATLNPETLLAQPRFRKALWHGWLDWTKGNT